MALRTRAPGLGAAHAAPLPRRASSSRPLPGRSSVHRCLVRHRLIEPQKRRRKREDYRRWERLRAMELWQMDVMGGVRLDGRRRAQARHRHRRPLALLRLRAAHAAGHGAAGLRGLPRRHAPPRRPRAGPHRQRQGLHGALRTRHGPGALRPHLPRERHPPPADRAAQPDDHRQGRALPQDACAASSSPGRVFASLEEAQAALDEWVAHYNAERPHQGIGMVAAAAGASSSPRAAPRAGRAARGRRRGASRPSCARSRASSAANGTISFEAARYHAGAWLAGEAVELTLRDGLARDRPPRRARRLPRAPPRPPEPRRRRGAPRRGPGRAPCRRSPRARR